LWSEFRLEAMSHTVEAGVEFAKGAEPSGKFEAPPELSADLVASQHWQKLAETWKTLAQLTSGLLTFDTYLLTLNDALKGLEFLAAGVPGKARGSVEAYRTFVQQAEVRDDAGKVQRALDKPRNAIETFLQTANSPLLDRKEEQILQDLWIKWIADKKFGDAIDAIESVQKQLRAANVLNCRGASGSRLGFPRLGNQESIEVICYGDDLTYTGRMEAAESAFAEKERIEHIGRLGVVVVIDSPRWTDAAYAVAVVRLGHDAYAAAGRIDPDPKRKEEYFIVSDSAFRLRLGQVVVITDIDLAGTQGLEHVSRRQVTDDEILEGLKILVLKRPLISPQRRLKQMREEQQGEWQKVKNLGPEYGPKYGPEEE
jgi:hypothetical protein